jgi:hypothetical protein
VSREATPPVATPQLSPDGQWVWDGAQWRPVAVREAAFPAFKKAGESVPTRGNLPPAQRPATPSPLMRTPVWGKPAGKAGIPTYAYIGGGALAALIVVALLLVAVPALLASAKPTGSSTPASTPTAAPGPAARSESARAAYTVSTLAAPMANLKDATSQVAAICRPGMTTSCEEAVISASSLIDAVTPLLQQLPVAGCVTAQQNRLATDMNTLNTAVLLVRKAFKDGKKAEFSSGIKTTGTYASRVQSDYAAIKTASGGCSTDVVGP